jgi:PKD repeat protein
VPVVSSLTPLIVAAGFSTEFKVVVNSSFNITKYRWNFGDGTTKETTTAKVNHTYNEEDTYELTVNVSDVNQKTSSKTFSVLVGDPSKEINKTISQKLSYIDNFKSQINVFDASTKERLYTLFSIDENENELRSIKADFENEEDYSTIIGRLNDIKVPESIRIGIALSDLSFFPDDSVIDPYIVNEFVSGNYSDDLFEDYINAIVAWNLADITSKVSMAKFIIKIDGQEKTLRVFGLDITNSGSDKGYLFIKDMEGLSFGGNYSQEQESEFTVIRLSGNDNIIFSTTEEVDFTELPAFISPELDILDVKAHNPTPTLNLFDWKLYALIVGILIVGWMIIYTILYNWYKRKYEVHLFSNRNNLLNLVTYINNEKRRGIPDNEIEKSLKKSKWSSEQITYAMRKYAGKRTGMLELPFFRIFAKKSKENITLKEYRGFRNDMFNQRAFIF